MSDLGEFDLGQIREKYRVPLEKGEVIAEKVRQDLAPLADVLVLVGSIRRRRVTIADVEFVVLPKDPDEFHRAVTAMGFEAGGKRRKYTGVRDGLKIELYVARKPEELGAMVLAFTGDFLWNVALRSKAKRMKLKMDQYGIWRGQRPVLQSMDERDFFDFLGMDWHEPEQRSLAARSELEKTARAVIKAERVSPDDLEFAREALRKLKADKYLPAAEEVVLRSLHEKAGRTKIGHSLGAEELLELGAEELIELGDEADLENNENTEETDDGWQALYEVATGRFGKLRGIIFEGADSGFFEVWAEAEEDGQRVLYRVVRASRDSDGLMILEHDFVEKALEAPWPWEGPFWS